MLKNHPAPQLTPILDPLMGGRQRRASVLATNGYASADRQMVVDGRALGQGDVFETDVCVVGAGPAGITLALELARSGCRVCLLESGGRAHSAAAEKLSAGKSVGYWYYPLADTRARALVRWLASPADAAEGWRARPLDPVDFERRACV